jgi:hypothetical protein
MIIHNVAKVERTDIADFSWFSLRTFHNVRFTTEAIVRSHRIPKKYLKHAEKQADQIRFFLLQAKEYFDASRTVTLVTRPVLLYYSVMCLATAEVLFKQSGDNSLDKARESHRHHGLVFTNRNTPKDRDSAATKAASGLLAQPATRDKGERYGTFELWHRSARGYPLPSESIEFDRTTQSQMSRFTTFAISRDERLPLIPESGITLSETLEEIPGMATLITQLGRTPNLVRGHVSKSVDATTRQTELSIIIHPGDKAKTDAFFEGCKFNANDHTKIDFKELTNGGILKISHPEADPVRFNIPSSSCDKFPTVSFVAEDEKGLNEFGFLYVALYIVGNYARYYPDFWIYDVEKSTQLGLLIEHLLNVAEQRICLLALSELSQVYYIPA